MSIFSFSYLYLHLLINYKLKDISTQLTYIIYSLENAVYFITFSVNNHNLYKKKIKNIKCFINIRWINMF